MKVQIFTNPRAELIYGCDYERKQLLQTGGIINNHSLTLGCPGAKTNEQKKGILQGPIIGCIT